MKPQERQLPLSILIACIAERMSVVRAAGDDVPIGCERELLAQTLPHLQRLQAQETRHA